MSTNRNLSIALSLALSAVICAPAARAQDSAKVERPSADLITRSQIVDSKANSVRDVVESLRSNWLIEKLPVPQSRALQRQDTTKKSPYSTDYSDAGKSMPGQAGGIQVYIDGTRVGGLDELKNIHAAEVYSIRHYNGSEAQSRFGIGHGSGVIYVTTLTQSESKP